jgi:hypothetical protein
LCSGPAGEAAVAGEEEARGDQEDAGLAGRQCGVWDVTTTFRRLNVVTP